MSFRLKVILIGVTVSAISLIYVGSTLLSSLEKQILDHSATQAGNKVTNVINRVGHAVENKSIAVEQAARIVGTLSNDEVISRDEKVHQFLRGFVIDYPEIISLTLLYDNADGFAETEMIRYYFFNEGGNLLYNRDTLSKAELSRDHPHFASRKSSGIQLKDGFVSNVWKENAPSISLTVPVLDRGQFLGSLAAEISLHDLSSVVGDSWLFSSVDKLVYSPDSRQNGLFYKEADLPESVLLSISEKRNGSDYISWDLLYDRITISKTFDVGGTGTFWTVATVFEFAEIYKLYSANVNQVVFTLLLGLALLAVSLYLAISNIYRSFQVISNVADEMDNGTIDPENISADMVKGQEAREIITSLSGIAKDLKAKSDFTTALRDGNLEVEYKAGQDDTLGNALIALRDNLKINRDAAEMRRWTNEGLAHFSQILRENSEDFTALCSNLISELVRYMKANQGAIFLLDAENEDHPKLKLTAAYAYERRKFIEKSIEIDEGLVGQAFQERATIYLKEVPREYIRITSGLGDAVPSVLLIVPLKMDQVINGVIEIAGFKPFADHERAFLEKLAESIALTIHNTRNNEATRKLLEQSQIQAEELRSAEEEMRQNMEELQATQEELNRRAGETEQLLKESERKSDLSEFQIELSTLLSSVNSTKQVYQGILNEIGKKLNFDFAYGFNVEFEKGKRVLRPMGLFYSTDPERCQPIIELNSSLVFTPEEDIIGMCFSEQHPLFFDSLEQNDYYSRSQAAVESGLNSVYVMPVFTGKKVASILEFYYFSHQEEDIQIIQFATQIGKQLGEVLTRVKLSEASMVKEEEMAKWQFDMRAILDGLPVAMIVIDENGNIENNNKRFIDIAGIKALDVKKEPFFNMIEGDVPAFEPGAVYDISLKRGDGTVKEIVVRAERIHKNEGDRTLLHIDVKQQGVQ